MTPTRILAVILNWHSAPATLECMAALRRSANTELDLLVVDNGSTDGSASVLRETLTDAGTTPAGAPSAGIDSLASGSTTPATPATPHPSPHPATHPSPHPPTPGGSTTHPDRPRADTGALRQLSLLELPDNTGYAGGMNAALDWSAGRGYEYVLLITPDALVRPETVAHLVATLDTEPSAAIAGPVVVYREAGAGVERLVGAGGGIDERRLRAPLHRSVRGSEPYPVDWIDGCCMLLRREAVAEVGGFDESYFLYFEETDLCVRVGRAGWRVLLTPGAEVLHEKFGSPASYYYYYMNRNRYHFWRKNFGTSPIRTALAVARETLDLAASWTLSVLLPRRRARRSDDYQRLTRQLRGVVTGTADYRKGRLGEMGAGRMGSE